MPDHDMPAPATAPEQDSSPATSDAVSVDLSELKNFSFGPDWSATPSTEALVRKAGSRGGGRDGDRGRDGGGRDGPPFRRDRRPARSPTGSPGGAATAEARVGGPPNSLEEGSRAPQARFPADGREGGDRGFRRDGPFRGGRGERREMEPPFRPTLEVLFYPDDAAFRALTKAIRTSCKTYELFEVAQLLLQKPERFVVVLKPFPRTDGAPAQLFVSQPDLLPFETEEAAVAHVFDQHLEQFCAVEEIEVEAPKGNFVGVSKCGFTGELLGPPNYHRYQQLLREHHARRLARVPFDKFTARLELVKEPEPLQAWLEKMKKATRYKLKTPAEGAPEFFENLDAARQYLLAHRKDAIVRGLDLVRYSGKMLEKFAPGAILRSVETVLEAQRRFPLDTANNLRGRLRRMKFNLYKKGSKGVSFVCAVKRRFRDPQTVFADHVQKLIAFIEQHPLVPVTRLAHDFLGLPEAPAAAATPPPPGAATPPPVAPPPVEGAAPEAAPAVNPPAAAVEASSPAPVAPPPPTRTDSHLAPEQQLQLRELLINLRWLVSEGYVTEYGDGRLYAPPPQAPAKAKAAGPGHEADEHALTEDTPGPFTGGEEEAVETLDAAPVDATDEVLAAPAAPPAPQPPGVQ